MARPVTVGQHGVWRRGLSIAVAASLIMAQLPAVARAAEATPAAAVGGLSVSSDPAGAAIYVDGKLAGQTPASIPGLTAGDHRVRVVKDGYLENGRIVSVVAGQSKALDVKLTKYAGSATASSAYAATGGGGSFLTNPLFLAAVAGGVIAAVFLLKKNKPPVVTSVSASPTGTGMAGQTTFTIATSASDPEGKALTYDVDFGDSSAHGTAASATHVYSTAGTYTVKVTVSDGKNSVIGPTATVTVAGNLVGTWTGGTEPAFGANLALQMTQSGGNLGGNCVFSGALVGTITLTGTDSPVAYPSTVNTQCQYTVTGLSGTFSTNFSGSASSATTMTGTITTVTSAFGNFTASNQTFHK